MRLTNSGAAFSAGSVISPYSRPRFGARVSIVELQEPTEPLATQNTAFGVCGGWSVGWSSSSRDEESRFVWGGEDPR